MRAEGGGWSDAERLLAALEFRQREATWVFLMANTPDKADRRALYRRGPGEPLTPAGAPGPKRKRRRGRPVSATEIQRLGLGVEFQEGE